VLIVDDDDDIRSTARIVLEDAGYTVTDAATVTDAIRYITTVVGPHGVLLDYLLKPDGDATPFLRHLAETPALAARCAVISFLATPSRLFTTEYAEIAARLGVPTLAKPFDIDTLLALVAARAAPLLAGDVALRPTS
jgi:CheY-like chemotaxis protein